MSFGRQEQGEGRETEETLAIDEEEEEKRTKGKIKDLRAQLDWSFFNIGDTREEGVKGIRKNTEWYAEPLKSSKLANPIEKLKLETIKCVD